MITHDVTSFRMWQPLLQGREAEAALSLAAAIAKALVRETSSVNEAPAHNGLSPFLGYGQAGLAVLFAYCEKCFPGQSFDDWACQALERAILGVSEGAAPEGLYAGFSGVAWVIEHLRADLFDVEDSDPSEAALSGLRELLAQSPWRRHYDLVSGLTGLGVFALERLPHLGGSECLAQVIRQLSATAKEEYSGLTWPTPPETLGPAARQRAGQGDYNLGLAHGVPGVISFLGHSLRAGVREALPLLDGAVRWTLAQRLPPGARSLFPYRTSPGIEAEPTRLAWCYGDLGVAVALLIAARAANQPAWEAHALKIARFSAARTPESAQVADAGLCHGAAGLAHLFNRLYQATADPDLGLAAHLWFQHTLAMVQPGKGIGGYRFLIPQAQGEPEWGDEPGFLTGAAGVALSLLAGATAVEPAWDRLLLVDIPPQPATWPMKAEASP